MRMEPNVPISKPFPNKETYKDEEKKEDNKNTRGINPAARINLSLGNINFPSPNLAINQKNTESVVPTDNKKPLLAANVTGINGIKKNKDKNNVDNNVKNDNLLKNSTFFDSIFIITSPL